MVPVNTKEFYKSTYNSTLCLYNKYINKGTILVDICNYNLYKIFVYTTIMNI